MKTPYSGSLLLAVLVNFLLFAVKLYVGLRTNSLCIYTDGINNLLDTLSILLAFCGTLFLKKAATKKHPFGFGRIEYILEFMMSVLISLTGIAFAYNSLVRLMMPTPVWFYSRYAYIIGASCLVKLCLGFFFLHGYKKTKSDVLKTVMLDSFMDTGVTTVTLLSFTLANKIGLAIDGFMGLFISILIIISGIKLIYTSISRLLGREDEKTEKAIQTTLENFADQIKIKSMQIHDYGTEAKAIVLLLQASPELDKAVLSSQIKAQLQVQHFINISIEWEESSCLKQKTNQS